MEEQNVLLFQYLVKLYEKEIAGSGVDEAAINILEKQKREIERLQKIETENKVYTERLLKLYKNLCVGGKYDEKMPSGTAYDIILDIEKMAGCVLEEEIDHFLEYES